MKKLLLTTLAVLFTLSLFGRSRELNPKVIDEKITDWILDQLRDAGYTVLPEVIVQDTLNRNKKSNYEKYWEEKNGILEKPRHDPKPEFDDLYYQPSKDNKMMRHAKRDTIKKDTIVKKVIVNNYYSDNDYFYANRFRHFYHPTFYWGWNFYTPYYYGGWYEPFYYDWYAPYYSYNYWWGWSNWWHTPNYYVHNNYNYYGGGTQFKPSPQYGRRERPSNFTQTVPSRRTTATQTQTRTISQNRTATSPQNRTTYNESRRSYSPTYEHPRMSVRPQYNNSKAGNYQRHTEISTQTRTNVSTESRTYSSPQRRSENYTAPTRSYSPPAQQRSSEPQGFGRTFNFDSGGDRRSSGNSNFSSGSNSSSSGSGSSGGRSSGGSTSSGRR